MTGNGKATIREVRDLIDKLDDEKITPMGKAITRIETLLDTHLRAYENYCTKNDEEHKGFINSKSIKLIGVILGILISAATIWNTITFFMGG